MKKLLTISFTILGLLVPAAAHAEAKTYTVLLAGGSEANRIEVWLSPDGRQYVIDSVVPLDVGGSVCTHPPDNPNELLCDAPAIAGFEVNADGGDDRVSVAANITLPVTMRGGAGDDVLVGGGGLDKLVGGNGDDRLIGRRGADLLFGGPGADVLVGGPSADVLRGGPGEDSLAGGPGSNQVRSLSG